MRRQDLETGIAYACALASSPLCAFVDLATVRIAASPLDTVTGWSARIEQSGPERYWGALRPDAELPRRGFMAVTGAADSDPDEIVRLAARLRTRIMVQNAVPSDLRIHTKVGGPVTVIAPREVRSLWTGAQP